MNDIQTDDKMMNFLEDDIEIKEENKGNYKILIADDEEEIHKITKLILGHFTYEGMGLEFYDAYTGKETKEILESHPDIAIIFLDVVMEDTSSGLDVVQYIRDQLENTFIRIILRTGQPGQAPEESVIKNYDINDYRLKTELTSKRLLTTMYASLRNYRDLKKLEKHQIGLKKIIRASANLFNNNSLNNFLISILEELSSFQEVQSDYVYLRNEKISTSNGFVTMRKDHVSKIVAATGRYKQYTGKCIESIPELSHVYKYLPQTTEHTTLKKIENGFIITSQGNNTANNFIFVEGDHNNFDYDLINLFLSNFSIALDNFLLNNMIKDTQREIVFALAETVESHFEETGNHVTRISDMMYRFSLLTHFSFQEAEMLRLASTMHDLGKIAIPDAILKKPGKLTEDEFKIIKTHTTHGYKILNSADLPVLKSAAEIALNHHERFDGNGYPGGIVGRNIPMNARMMSIVDVYDALTHKRCYKDAISREETIEILQAGKGSQFDPDLLDIFLSNIDEILMDL